MGQGQASAAEAIASCVRRFEAAASHKGLCFAGMQPNPGFLAEVEAKFPDKSGSLAVVRCVAGRHDLSRGKYSFCLGM